MILFQVKMWMKWFVLLKTKILGFICYMSDIPDYNLSEKLTISSMIFTVSTALLYPILLVENIKSYIIERNISFFWFLKLYPTFFNIFSVIIFKSSLCQEVFFVSWWECWWWYLTRPDQNWPFSNRPDTVRRVDFVS